MFNPIKTIKTNVVGTLNMLGKGGGGGHVKCIFKLPLADTGLAKRVKAKLLLASTSEVYGDPKVSVWGPKGQCILMPRAVYVY